MRREAGLGQTRLSVEPKTLSTSFFINHFVFSPFLLSKKKKNLKKNLLKQDLVKWIDID